MIARTEHMRADSPWSQAHSQCMTPCSLARVHQAVIHPGKETVGRPIEIRVEPNTRGFPSDWYLHLDACRRDPNRINGNREQAGVRVRWFADHIPTGHWAGVGMRGKGSCASEAAVGMKSQKAQFLTPAKS
jgi:hypothetical protein